ncbi:major capsid protein [Nocardioides sp. ChNu-153]|uniref:major capsid protein n=1 Tax=unclassified Nocardioides TaxID=2615069 RepID=UPI00240735CD|nr:MULTISPECIES: major capsid protein [unclassified Nocardioides]MDF9718113.1 major capsid protein [Nocardioides sp. ChNu-99]MDN7120298.1 major capsid protein [Nocardioides sp. ChNu-153]
MYLNTDYIEPTELTGYVRQRLQDLAVNQFRLSRFLPDRPIDDIDYRFTRGGEGLIEAATFRSYDTPSRFGSRPGAVRVSGQLPPVSRQIKLGEYDRLKLRQASDDAIVNAIYDDADRMARAVAARMELARGEALTTGKVVINEGGVVASVDYGRKGTHTVVAGTPWTTLTAPALENLIAWRDTYRASNGASPAAALTSQRVISLLQRNAEVIAAIAGTQTGRTRVNRAELDDLLASEELPPLVAYDAQVAVNKQTVRVIAEDKLVFTADQAPLVEGEDGDYAVADASEMGATLWGTTAESLEEEYGLAGDEAGIVAGVYKQPNPLSYFTNAVGIGLPVLANPDLTFSADVF